MTELSSKFLSLTAQAVGFCLTACMLLTDCSKPRVSNTVELEIIVDTIRIQIDSVALDGYKSYDILSSDSGKVLLAYNDVKHSFDVFDLTQATTRKRINLSYNGPDGIGELDDLHAYSEDSIFAYCSDTREVYLLNSIGELDWKLSMADVVAKNELNYLPNLNIHFRLRYLNDIKSIPFYNLYPGSPGNYDLVPQLSIIHLRTNSIRPISFYHSTSGFNKNAFGFLNYVAFSDFSEEQLFVNHLYSNSAFSVDYKSTEISEIFKFESGFRELSPGEDWSDHAASNTFYNELFQLTNGIMLRLEWNGMTASEIDAANNPFLNKQYILRVWSGGNFDIDTTLDLGRSFIVPYGWNQDEDDIYFMTYHPLNDLANEDELQLLRIAIEE